MHYDLAITVPANTPRDSAIETECVLCPGIVHHIELDFHPGHAGLVHVVIERGLRQVWPTNPEKDFYADSRIIAWNDYYELLETPYSFIIKAWNLDDTYEHEVVVSFAVLEQDVISPPSEGLPILKRLSRYFFGG